MGVLAPKLLLEWLLVSGRLLVPGFSGQNAKSSRKPIFPLRNVSKVTAPTLIQDLTRNAAIEVRQSPTRGLSLPRQPQGAACYADLSNRDRTIAALRVKLCREPK